jgi:hypothetical protein
MTQTLRIVSRFWPAVVLSLLALWLFAPGRAVAQQTIVQQFFVPFPEADFQNSLKAIDTTGTAPGATIETIIAITIGTSNTVVTYDQWEDGYENDLNHPQQASTLIWGDGNATNGVPPGVSTNGRPVDVLLPGDVILLTNLVTLPRNPSVFNFDGRDRIGATKAVTVTKVSWAVTPARC